MTGVINHITKFISWLIKVQVHYKVEVHYKCFKKPSILTFLFGKNIWMITYLKLSGKRKAWNLKGCTDQMVDSTNPNDLWSQN